MKYNKLAYNNTIAYVITLYHYVKASVGLMYINLILANVNWVFPIKTLFFEFLLLSFLLVFCNKFKVLHLN